MSIQKILSISIFLLSGCNTLADLKQIEEEPQPKEFSIADCELSPGRIVAAQSLGLSPSRIALLANSGGAVLSELFQGDQGGRITRIESGPIEDRLSTQPVQILDLEPLTDISLSQDSGGFTFSVSSSKLPANGVDIGFGYLDDTALQEGDDTNTGFEATASVGGMNPFRPQDSEEKSRFVWLRSDQILVRGIGISGTGAPHGGEFTEVNPGDLLYGPGPHVFHWSPDTLTAIDVFDGGTFSGAWNDPKPTSLVYLGDNRYLMGLYDYGGQGRVYEVVVGAEGFEIETVIPNVGLELTAFSIFAGEGFLAVAYVLGKDLTINFFEYIDKKWRDLNQVTLAEWGGFRAIQGAVTQDPKNRCGLSLWMAGVDSEGQATHILKTRLGP